jgi:hypothetical protein
MSVRGILGKKNMSVVLKYTLEDGNATATATKYQYNRSLKRIEKLQYMNNLDIVLALVTTPKHRFSRFLIQRLHFKPQQVQLQTGFRRTLPMSSTSKTVLNSYD